MSVERSKVIIYGQYKSQKSNFFSWELPLSFLLMVGGHDFTQFFFFFCTLCKVKLLNFWPLLCTDLEEEEYAEDQQVPPYNLSGRQQQGLVKSNQSHTSVEDNIPYDEDQEDEEEEDREETPAKKRTISANRVSFRDESEIREIVSRATVDISIS